MSQVKVSNNSGEVTGYRVEDFQYTSFGKMVLHRLLNNRDMKIMITSSGNTTGTGKTTLAIILAWVISDYVAEIFDRDFQWKAEEHSFIDVMEYLRKYESAENGDILITDEIEYMADKRRSMSNENVFFSQAWAMLRYKNVITIGTAPSMFNLDRRIPENTDIWINVKWPGIADVYYMTADDFTGEVIPKRVKQCGFIEQIRWEPIDDCKDYHVLTNRKSDVGVPGLSVDGEEEITEEDINEAKREVRDTYIENLLRYKDRGHISATQEEIANLAECSQQQVSKVKGNSDIEWQTI